MIYILYGLGTVLTVLLLGYVTIKAIDCCFDWNTPKAWAVVAVVCWAIVLGGVFHVAVQEENKGPCLRYETSMYYNAGTKTMMPARRCAERAEWVQ